MPYSKIPIAHCHLQFFGSFVAVQIHLHESNGPTGWACICKRVPNAFANELCLCRQFFSFSKLYHKPSKAKPQYCQVWMVLVRAGRSAPVVILLLAWTQRSLCHTCVNRIVQITKAKSIRITLFELSVRCVRFILSSMTVGGFAKDFASMNVNLWPNERWTVHLSPQTNRCLCHLFGV